MAKLQDGEEFLVAELKILKNYNVIYKFKDKARIQKSMITTTYSTEKSKGRLKTKRQSIVCKVLARS
ncbi:hypothetical protein Tco_1318506 [Tanacetum coccineum]